MQKRLFDKLSFEFACRKLCGLNLKRPHMTCLYCASRKAYYGKGYRHVRFIDTYILNIDRERRFAKTKDLLLKKLLTICEMLAT
jgi:hypothetical protein